MPTSENVIGGSSGAFRCPDARELKNSPTIWETDLPRWLASILAVRISSVSIRNVNLVFMPYKLLNSARLVNQENQKLRSNFVTLCEESEVLQKVTKFTKAENFAVL